MSRFALLGPSGNGKTSLANTSTGSRLRVGHGFSSTTKTKQIAGDLVDLQGTNDTDGVPNDRVFEDALRGCMDVGLAGFLIVQSIGERRYHIDISIQSLKSFFGDDIERNIAIIFTGVHSANRQQESLFETAKNTYANYQQVYWESGHAETGIPGPTPAMRASLEAVKTTLRAAPTPRSIAAVFADLHEAAKQLREREKTRFNSPIRRERQVPEPYIGLAPVSHTYSYSDDWTIVASTAPGFFIIHPATWVIDDHTRRTKIVPTDIPSGAKIISEKLSISKSRGTHSSDWHKIKLLGDHKLELEAKFSHNIAGEAWIRYNWSAEVTYEVQEKVEKTRNVTKVDYEDNFITQYKHDMAHYTRLIFDQRLGRLVN